MDKSRFIGFALFGRKNALIFAFLISYLLNIQCFIWYYRLYWYNSIQNTGKVRPKRFWITFVTIGLQKWIYPHFYFCKIFCLHLYRSIFTFMNNRLQQFLELENITPARLADTLGVQRSGLSHILSGRNKPGYEFLTKLLLKFPHINSESSGEGNGNTLQYSCLENPMDRGA